MTDRNRIAVNHIVAAALTQKMGTLVTAEEYALWKDFVLHGTTVKAVTAFDAMVRTFLSTYLYDRALAGGLLPKTLEYQLGIRVAPNISHLIEAWIGDSHSNDAKAAPAPAPAQDQSTPPEGAVNDLHDLHDIKERILRLSDQAMRILDSRFGHELESAKSSWIRKIESAASDMELTIRRLEKFLDGEPSDTKQGISQLVAEALTSKSIEVTARQYKLWKAFVKDVQGTTEMNPDVSHFDQAVRAFIPAYMYDLALAAGNLPKVLKYQLGVGRSDEPLQEVVQEWLQNDVVLSRAVQLASEEAPTKAKGSKQQKHDSKLERARFIALCNRIVYQLNVLADEAKREGAGVPHLELSFRDLLAHAMSPRHPQFGHYMPGGAGHRKLLHRVNVELGLDEEGAIQRIGLYMHSTKVLAYWRMTESDADVDASKGVDITTRAAGTSEVTCDALSKAANEVAARVWMKTKRKVSGDDFIEWLEYLKAPEGESWTDGTIRFSSAVHEMIESLPDKPVIKHKMAQLRLVLSVIGMSDLLKV